MGLSIRSCVKHTTGTFGVYLAPPALLMPCLNCTSHTTIKAHLIPQAFAKEVNVGKAHAAGVTKVGRFWISQAGRFDSNILCADCDNGIGRFEAYAVKALARLRKAGLNQPLGHCVAEDVDGNQFLRFCAALLWKYSVTGKEQGRIRLGPYQSIARALAFDPDSVIPESFDAFITRPMRKPDDQEVIFYRAPLLERREGVNFARFSVGGCVVFVRLDKRPLAEPFFAPCWIKGKNTIKFAIAPATVYEEFQTAQRLMNEDEKLSGFLERQESQAAIPNSGS